MKTTLQVIGGIILAIVIIVALMVLGFGADMFGLELGKHVENKRMEVTRQTNSFVTTQQKLLNQYAKEYRAAEEDDSRSQMALIRTQMEDIAVQLDPEDIPPAAVSILEGGR